MSRQIGAVPGVAILLALIGSPSAATVVHAFHDGWWFTAAAALSASLGALAVPWSGRRATA
jgi:hypothetical protein